MTLDAKTAVVDNDFINHVIESNLKDEDLVTVLNTVFSELDLTAVMHPLVYEKELLPDKDRIKLLFCKSIVQKAEFGDIFQNDAAKERYYIFLVSELYRALTGKALSATGKAVLSYWVRQNSLGEVHSVAMCLTCGCGIFLSDDGDSKALKAYVEQKAIGKINVYNREEFIQKHMEEGITKLSRTNKRSLTHAAK